jgi:hypothetical protein
MDCRKCSSDPILFSGRLLSLSLLVFVLFAGCSRPSRAGLEPAAQSALKPVEMTCRFCGDSDEDGIPDTAELRSYEDRQNFRRWFTFIAEMQYYRLSDAWKADQRDCAGLVRFAWREALRRHDRLWFQARGEGYEPVAPDIRAYSLDRSPLGETLFREDYGTFEEGDLEAGRFSDFADARTIKNHNAVFASRDRRQARPGDLLFFHRPGAHKLPYHIMIFLGQPQQGAERDRDWVVYHTGSGAQGAPGEVKLLRLSLLDRHPDRQWRPVEENRNFLGFYRLKILE